MAMRDAVAETLQEEEAEITLTPMLDVVFIMLIFFIVTAVFVREPGIQVNRPEAVTAMIPNSGSIFIAVNAANEFWIDQRSVDLAGLGPVIERLRAQNPVGGVVIDLGPFRFKRTLARRIFSLTNTLRGLSGPSPGCYQN